LPPSGAQRTQAFQQAQLLQLLVLASEVQAHIGMNFSSVIDIAPYKIKKINGSLMIKIDIKGKFDVF
jgi:hypothetical protein